MRREAALLMLVLALVVSPALSQLDSNDVIDLNESAAPKPKIKLDATLRRALLKALTDLENEEGDSASVGGALVEKASASSVTFFANQEEIKNEETTSTSTTTTPSTTTTTTSTTTTEAPTILFQKSEISTEQSFTSFERDENNIENESILTSASNNNLLGGASKNLLSTNDKPIKPVDESETKAEQVQFFQAPLVAAFTVHQDEIGNPQKVENILTPSVLPTIVPVPPQIPSTSTQQPIVAPTVVPSAAPASLDLITKQKMLEQEIARLKLVQQQQETYFKQQLLLREQLRENNNNFRPLLDEPTRSVLNQFVIRDRPLQNSFPDEFARLPQNAQILPIKEHVDFHTPFNKFPQINFNSFQQPSNNNRFLRQEQGVGNFGNTFSIQQSLQPLPPVTENGVFFRSNLDLPPSIRQGFFEAQRNNQQTRFFRSQPTLDQLQLRGDLRVVGQVLGLNGRRPLDNPFPGAK